MRSAFSAGGHALTATDAALWIDEHCFFHCYLRRLAADERGFTLIGKPAKTVNVISFIFLIRVSPR